MATRVDSVLHDLELLQSNLEKPGSYEAWFSELREDFETLKLNLLFLKTFLLCARNWSNDQLTVRPRSFLSKIEGTVDKPGMDIRSLYLYLRSNRRSNRAFKLKGVVTSLIPVVSNLGRSIKSFKEEIIDTYTTLSESGSCLRDCDLVDLIDSVLQNLADLLSRRHFESMEDYNSDLHAHIEALADKLTFLKNFVGYAKFLGVEERDWENLLAHVQFVALNAARLSYKCLFYREDEEMDDSTVCSIISELLEQINPVDLQTCETYGKVLTARISPESLLTMQTNMQDFTDSLMAILWELLWCTGNFPHAVKRGFMEILYVRLRLLRSILNEPPENMKSILNGPPKLVAQQIVDVINEAGIVILSLFWYGVHDEEDFFIARESGQCVPVRYVCDRLDKINNSVGSVVLELSRRRGPSISGSLPSSYDSLRGFKVREITRFKPSRGRVPITNDIVVGFEDEAKKVIDRLIFGPGMLELVPIVGMPGLGKTTLAKKIYNDPVVRAHFRILLWCSVSQDYNFRDLLVQILSCVYRVNEGLNVNVLSEDDLAFTLHKRLIQDRYLVVLDDVRDSGVWHGLSSSLPDNRNGSRVLITTRDSRVASEIQFGVEPHNLRVLTEEESWELLQKKVFGQARCPQPLRMLGKEIATNCKGLPFAIVIIAGILSTIEDDDWHEVADTLSSTIAYDTDPCKNTLELSYIHLPHHLKPCLLYFGAFREDQEIQTAKLMRLWIAEGFASSEVLVLDTELKRIEDLAEEYLMDLIGRNLVMVAKQRHIGGVKACRIHDLVHEFCKDKAKQENFLLALHGYGELSNFNELLRPKRLSIWSKVEHFKKSRLFCPQVQSLLVFSQIEESDSFMVDMSFVFCIFKKLRVLDLEQIFLPHKVFPREVEALVELRYLGVQGAMRSVAPSIDELSNLETFVLITESDTAESGTVSLPDTIWNMTKLRHLHVVGWNVTCSLPSENLENTSDLWNLDTLSVLIVSSDDRVENIMRKIPNVRQLKIQLSAAEWSTGYCNLCHLSSLETLEVLAESLQQNPVEFSFPLHLKELVLGGLHLPWSKISVIERLPRLQVLTLLGESFVGERWELTGGGFPELRCLFLENLDVVEWEDATDSDDALRCLQKLRLTGVSQLEKVPSCLGCISLLEEIEVRDCTDSLKALVHKIVEQQLVCGNRDLKMID